MHRQELGICALCECPPKGESAEDFHHPAHRMARPVGTRQPPPQAPSHRPQGSGTKWPWRQGGGRVWLSSWTLRTEANPAVTTAVCPVCPRQRPAWSPHPEPFLRRLASHLLAGHHAGSFRHRGPGSVPTGIDTYSGYRFAVPAHCISTKTPPWTSRMPHPPSDVPRAGLWRRSLLHSKRRQPWVTLMNSLVSLWSPPSCSSCSRGQWRLGFSPSEVAVPCRAGTGAPEGRTHSEAASDILCRIPPSQDSGAQESGAGNGRGTPGITFTVLLAKRLPPIPTTYGLLP